MISDETAYRRYLNGEEQAADLLVERYGDALTLYINARIRDAHEAEDLMIEVFAYLIAKKPHIRDGGFRAFLYQSARHMAKPPEILPCGTAESTASPFCTWTIWTLSRRVSC